MLTHFLNCGAQICGRPEICQETSHSWRRGPFFARYPLSSSDRTAGQSSLRVIDILICRWKMPGI